MPGFIAEDGRKLIMGGKKCFVVKFY